MLVCVCVCLCLFSGDFLVCGLGGGPDTAISLPSFDLLFPEYEWSIRVGTYFLAGEGNNKMPPNSLVLSSNLMSSPLSALSSAGTRAGGSERV